MGIEFNVVIAFAPCYQAGVGHETKHLPIATLLRANPRRNLPRRFTAKREESNFVLAFGRAYAAIAMPNATGQHCLPARELRVEGYGIADFIWVSCRSQTDGEEGSALGLHSPRRPRKQTLLAFEMKIHDWRKALAQARRYRYFADAAHVVLPPRAAENARLFLQIFRELEVGLWSFDKANGRIRRFYTPRRKTPLSITARQRAVITLRGSSKFRQLFEQLDAFAQRF